MCILCPFVNEIVPDQLKYSATGYEPRCYVVIHSSMECN